MPCRRAGCASRPLPAWPLLAAVLLAGCASRPPERDGPGPRPPPGLERTPDAVPRIEPLRAGGPNKPYEVFGQRYVPHATDVPLAERGLASWYGIKFHGQPTSLGETYDMYAMTAAHRTMPLPSYARVRNPANGREVVVRVNDRGPFVAGRVIDLSYTAALRLGLLAGVAPVEVRRITHDEIRRGGSELAAAPAVAAPATAATAAMAATVAPTPAPTLAPTLTPALTPAFPTDDPAPGDVPPMAGTWLQLGAFRQRDGAEALRERVLRATGTQPPGLVPMLRLSEDAGLVRVHAGPYAGRADALAAATRLRELLGIDALPVELR